MKRRKHRDARPPRRRQRLVYAPPPTPLKRPPRTDLAARADELDKRTFAAVDAVVARIAGAVEQSTSLDDLRRLGTQWQMLLAMKGTHRSIRRLVGGDEMELSLDALPLTRVQLERCFLALLLADNPARWHGRYRKNAWKAFAEKFFRDQRTLGHFEPYGEYFGPSGEGVRLLRQFAHEMDVSEDEFQTLRVQVTGDEPDPRFRQWFIADMPTPGRCLQELTGATHKRLALLLYPCYDNLSHFSHGGLVGIMQAAILRSGSGAGGDQDDRDGEARRRRFWASNVLEQTLPLSYVSLLLVATLLARPHLDDEELREALLAAWRPYHSDGSPLGVALWDAWASDVLRAGGDPHAGDDVQ